MAPPVERTVLDVVLAHGRDAMSFLAVAPGMKHWFDLAPPGGTGACVAYVETPGAWVAACGPISGLAPDDADGLSRATSRFAERARPLRACFFGSEAPELPGWDRLLVGEQPIFRPRQWLAALGRRRGLREQLRRARAKGLRVHRVHEEELRVGAPLRIEVDRLATGWLRSHHIEPMGFLVALAPFCHPEHHRYYVAEASDGRVVAFLSAVPIGSRSAWSIQDVFRSSNAPNGTTETLLVAMMREVEDSAYVTLGLTPLSGPVAWRLRIVRWISRPLFDFEGLRAFRERMHPDEWQPVWLVHPRGGSRLWAIVDSLRAFARGSLVGFAARSFARHPSGLPWALALPLPAWTAALVWLTLTRRAFLLGFPRAELALWAAFDALMLLVLVRGAMRPRRSRLLVATAFAIADAVLSVGHLAWVGTGHSPLQAMLRTAATVAPIIGALSLSWATTRAE